MKYATTILKVSVHGEDAHPVFGEGNIYISVEDEAGGPFLIIEQDFDEHDGTAKIRVEYQELVAINEAAKMLMHQLYIEKLDLEK